MSDDQEFTITKMLKARSDGEDYAVNTFRDSTTRKRTAGENKYIERTRKYPFRLGLGPAASEEYLTGLRLLNMRDAERISDAVPRRKED